MKRVYVDMDDVLADFSTRFQETVQANPAIQYPQSQYGFFEGLDPLPEAIESMQWLGGQFDTWILSRPSVLNPLCYTEKRVWVQKWLGLVWCHKLILCPDKSLLKGDFLIDDQPWPGFEGRQLVFGSDTSPNWRSVRALLASEANPRMVSSSASSA